MTDSQEVIQALLDGEPLREPLFRRLIPEITLPPGSRGLDIGCGIGLHTLLLAEAVGTGGHVTGMDIDPELLAYGEKRTRDTGMAERITFREGDMNKLPFGDSVFDWAWSVDCVGYPAGEVLPILQEIRRVLKPGGMIAILAWTSQQVLPGYSLLEARLNAASSAYLPYLKNIKPEQHFMRLPTWMEKAGFGEIQARTFLGEVHAPLSVGERTALVSLFDMLWGQPQPGESTEDRKDYERLCLQGSADFILDQPGYYSFFTYTMFYGKVR